MEIFVLLHVLFHTKNFDEYLGGYFVHQPALEMFSR